MRMSFLYWKKVGRLVFWCKPDGVFQIVHRWQYWYKHSEIQPKKKSTWRYTNPNKNVVDRVDTHQVLGTHCVWYIFGTYNTCVLISDLLVTWYLHVPGKFVVHTWYLQCLNCIKELVFEAIRQLMRFILTDQLQKTRDCGFFSSSKLHVRLSDLSDARNNQLGIPPHTQTHGSHSVFRSRMCVGDPTIQRDIRFTEILIKTRVMNLFFFLSLSTHPPPFIHLTWGIFRYVLRFVIDVCYLYAGLLHVMPTVEGSQREGKARGGCLGRRK